MNSYSTVSERYLVFDESRFQIIYTTSDQVDVVSEAHSQLRRALRNDPDSGLDEIVKCLKYLRYRLITNVLPFDDVDLGLRELSRELNDLERSLSQTSPEFQYVQAASKAIEILVESKVNPIEIIVSRILQDFDGQCVVALQNGKYRLRTQEHLESRGFQGQVLQASQLKSLEVVDKLILVGPPKLFDESIWSSPCARFIHVVQYPQGEELPKTDGLFGLDAGLMEREFVESGISSFTRKIELFNEIEDLKDLVTRYVRGHSIHDGPGETIGAVLIALGGDHGVWTEFDESNYLLCVDADRYGHGQIIKKQVMEVSPGDFLLLREGESDPDYIREIANSKFGAIKYRKNQTEWKQALNMAVVAAGGLTSSNTILSTFGARVFNLKYWIGKGIGPGSFRDFEAVCRFSKLSIDVETRYQEIEKIRGAHQKAGAYIRKELQKNLLESGIEELMETGYQSYEVQDLGKIAAFEVKFKDDQIRQVLISHLDRPFRMEEN